MDFANLQQWVGRTESASGVAQKTTLAGLAATLDYPHMPWPQDHLPLLSHWLYLPPQTRQSEIGGDGHALRGGFLPPVALPRRMWAGSSVVFHSLARVGDVLRRESTINAVEHKSGKSGELVFVKLRHVWSTASGPWLTEQQDIVYREAPAASSSMMPLLPAAPPARHADWTRQIRPDPVLLFRFSALTFNAHRIHYDRVYCQQEESYPGLVVHGPLTATLLMDLFIRNNPGARVAAFSFRGQRPLFDTGIFTLCGAERAGGVDLWALDEHGQMAMSAELELA